jgi:hypothetical protein
LAYAPRSLSGKSGEEFVGLFDTSDEEPKSKIRRYVISAIAFVVLVALGFWYLLRFYPEKRAAETFLSAVVAGDMDRAYKLWNPPATSSYTMKDFLDDWGPTGYYGPVKSYQIETASNPPKGGSGVIVIVDVSPVQPFPADNDVANNRRSKVVRLWVERSDKSLSFAP